MNQVRPIITRVFLIALLAASSNSQIASATDWPPAQELERSVVDVDFLDVPEIPARIDSLTLEADGKRIRLICAVANRSGEELLGLRLVLLAFDETGKFRGRLSWTERFVLAGFSIQKATFQPPGLRSRAGGHLVLGIDEVIGRETIWRATGLEKALRAYARGQHDVLPAVRIIPNKFDSRSLELPVFPPLKPH